MHGGNVSPGGYGCAGRGDANPAGAKAVGMKRIDVRGR